VFYRCLNAGSSSGGIGTRNEGRAKVQLLLRTLQSSPPSAGLARELEAAGAEDYCVTVIEPLKPCHHLLTIRFHDLRRSAFLKRPCRPSSSSIARCDSTADKTGRHHRRAISSVIVLQVFLLLQQYCFPLCHSSRMDQPNLHRQLVSHVTVQSL